MAPVLVLACVWERASREAAASMDTRALHGNLWCLLCRSRARVGNCGNCECAVWFVLVQFGAFRDRLCAKLVQVSTLLWRLCGCTADLSSGEQNRHFRKAKLTNFANDAAVLKLSPAISVSVVANSHKCQFSKFGARYKAGGARTGSPCPLCLCSRGREQSSNIS